MSGRSIDAAAYADAERRLARLLGTEHDVVVLQGEAIIALEAAARGVGGPGVRVLNLVSGPYGTAIGDWLAIGGAEVKTLTGAFDRALDAGAVASALTGERFDVVSVVHAEAATGVVNPLGAIAAAAHAAGAMVLVDAVASVGAEPLEIDVWDLDLVVIGPQKALGGPAGVCAVITGERGWARIAANPSAPRGSILSLRDWKERWVDAGRRSIPGYAHEHEMRALVRMLDDLDEDVGLRRLIDRHHRARQATRAGARLLGLAPWVAEDADAASVVTLLRPVAGTTVQAIARAAADDLDDRPSLAAAAPGPLAAQALRVNHTGPASRGGSVLAALAALAGALSRLGHDPAVADALAAAHRELTIGASTRETRALSPPAS